MTAFLEWLCPSDLAALEPYSSTLSVLLNERGGIIDDTIITKHAADAFYVVTNAGRRDADLVWFKQKVAEWNASERAKDDSEDERDEKGGESNKKGKSIRVGGPRSKARTDDDDSDWD